MKTPPTAGQIIASRSDRLGARLIAIANTMRLAASYGIEYQIRWLEKWELTDPTDIFTPEFVSERFISPQEFTERRHHAAPFSNFSSDRQNADAFLAHIAHGEDIILDTVFGIHVFQGENAEEVQRLFLEQFDAIPFAKPLLPHMEILRTRLSDPAKETVAYHIRRGDLVNDIQAMNRKWPNKFVPDAFFERHIETRLARQAETILFSDSEVVLAEYKAKFPGLILVADMFAFDGLTQAQIDFLELYAMSCCQKIVAPLESAFSQTAQTIGGADFVAVENDLSEEERTAAFEALCDSLEHRPDDFANEGDIGQCLVYADRYLCEANRKKDIARIMSGYVADGMCLSFVFAILFRRLFETGQYEEILRMRRFVDEGYVYNLRSFAQVALYHGCAHLMLGQKAEGLRQITAAFWHEPVEGEINALCSSLIHQGELDEKNFWFSDRAITRYMHNSWSHRSLEEHYPAMLEQEVLTPGKHLPTCRPLVWEWTNFTRAHLNAHYRFKGHFKTFTKGLRTRKWHEYERVHAMSFLALSECLQGNLEEAKRLAQQALEIEPDNALFHKRMVDVFLGLDDLGAAADHAREAIRLDPDARMYAALLGHCQQRAGDMQAALGSYQMALRDDVLAFPTIYFAAATCCDALNAPEMELEFMEKGLALSPTQWREQVRRGKLLGQLDRGGEALDVFRRTHRWADRRPPVTLGLGQILDQLDRPEEAIKVLSDAADRYPDKPQFKKALQKARKTARKGSQ